MGDIKSSREIAMEKLANIEEPTEEERMQWKFIPKGEELAGKYLKDDINILNELTKYNAKEKKYVVLGASQVLVHSLDLPRNENIKKTNRRSMDALKLIKKDKPGVENIYSRIRQLFNHYAEQGEQQRKAAYEQTKAQFAVKLQQAMQQQMGANARMAGEVERHPQFKDEWRRVLSQLDSQYIQYLGELKQAIIDIE